MVQPQAEGQPSAGAGVPKGRALSGLGYRGVSGAPDTMTVPAHWQRTVRGHIAEEDSDMADLKIRVFKGTATEPSTTVSIPVSVLKIASNLMPAQAAAELHENGIDLEAIIRASEDPNAHGTLVVVEQHEKDERIVIAVE
jgi:hypothetical protein